MLRNVQGETSFAKIRARSSGCVKEREAIQNERHQQFIAYEMELPISYRVCAKIAEEGIL